MALRYHEVPSARSSKERCSETSCRIGRRQGLFVGLGEKHHEGQTRRKAGKERQNNNRESAHQDFPYAFDSAKNASQKGRSCSCDASIDCLLIMISRVPHILLRHRLAEQIARPIGCVEPAARQQAMLTRSAL
ncbi:hypothetical protein [Tardiphaga sp. 619_E2_N8_5]|uniref:hypothetical protein n=1 Tax=unclassified Tardiphaga TaxID=2631404 RepID=UPI003F26124D